MALNDEEKRFNIVLADDETTSTNGLWKLWPGGMGSITAFGIETGDSVKVQVTYDKTTVIEPDNGEFTEDGTDLWRFGRIWARAVTTISNGSSITMVLAK